MPGIKCCKKEEGGRRRGEETRGKPFLRRGIIPIVPRIRHRERVPGRDINSNMLRGRSRSFPVPPQNVIRQQPHNQPCCLTAGFGYVAPNAHFPQRINPPSCPTFNPPCPWHLPPPPSPQNDTKCTSSESSDGDSLKAVHGSP